MSTQPPPPAREDKKQPSLHERLNKIPHWVFAGIAVCVILGLSLLGYMIINWDAFSDASPPQQIADIPQVHPPTATEQSASPQRQPGEGIQMQVPQMPSLRIVIRLSTIGLLLSQLVLFLETASRRERFMLDWWVVPLTVLVLSKRADIPNELWIAGVSVSNVLLIVATFINESQEHDEDKLGFIDTTALAVITGTLLILDRANLAWLPYPQYIPVWIVWVIFALSLFRELSRTPSLAILSFSLGIISAVTLDPWLITGSIAIVVVAVNIAARQGWVPSNKHQVDVPINIGGRELAITVPWDNVLAGLFAFLATCFTLYGDFVIFTIAGR